VGSDLPPWKRAAFFGTAGTVALALFNTDFRANVYDPVFDQLLSVFTFLNTSQCQDW
jgi:hypothetical protein